MDANKLKVLEQIYTIHPTCDICKHGDFQDGRSFGTCSRLTYVHRNIRAMHAIFRSTDPVDALDSS